MVFNTTIEMKRKEINAQCFAYAHSRANKWTQKGETKLNAPRIKMKTLLLSRCAHRTHININHSQFLFDIARYNRSNDFFFFCCIAICITKLMWNLLSLLNVCACVRACISSSAQAVNDHIVNSNVVQRQPIGHNVCVM